MSKLDTLNTYNYLNNFMTKEEYLEKLGNVRLVGNVKNQIRSGLFPNISLPSTMGGVISISEITKEKNAVLFFYPGDKEGLKYPELAGCTPEACSFRDIVKNLEKLNTKIFGISFQKTEKQRKLVEEQHLTFPLLSDSEYVLAKLLKLSCWISRQGELYPCRQTYVIGKGNQIIRLFDKVEPHSHVEEVYNEIKNINSNFNLK